MIYQDLCALLPVWQRRLGLADWRIVMVLGGCEDETAYMEVQHSTDYERAVVHVNSWLVGQGQVPTDVLMRDALTDDFIESSLVHELLHLHTRNLRVIIRDDLFGIVARDVHDQLKSAMSRADEQTVDRLAEALTKAFREEGA